MKQVKLNNKILIKGKLTFTTNSALSNAVIDNIYYLKRFSK